MAHASLPLHGDLPAPARPVLPLAAKGFRPFFLLAAAFAVAIVPAWLLVLSGAVHPDRYLGAVEWHAHEMVFGFCVAVVAGFLLTAVGNWTQRETLVGAPLLALAGLWVAGRVALFFAGALPRGVPAVVDLAFLPALGAVLARPLLAARNRRNFVMLAVLAVLFALDLAVHLDALGLAGTGAWRLRGSLVGVDVVVVLAGILGGRVFPMFTRNATGDDGVRSHPRLDRAAVAALAGLVAVDVAAPGRWVAGTVAALAAVLAVARAVHWVSRRAARIPLVWILHAGYAWLVVGLGLRAATELGAPVPISAAAHALTVGVLGSLTLGMMARVTLGHTGRPLVVPRSIVAAFALMQVAAIVRVAAGIALPSAYVAWMTVAGLCWSAAFALYLRANASALVSPRPDGKPG
jgi:uncharacterized protein involved in response to NO